MSEKGNVFTVLLAGVAMAGTLGYMTYQTMSGPLASMMRVTHASANTAKSMALSKAVILDSVSSNEATSGDCDSDGLIEPRQWTAGVLGAVPVNGGLLPSSFAPSVKDPWGTPYGYCVWDVGSSSDPAIAGTDITDDTGCPANARRLAGSPDPSSPAVSGAGTRTVFALISAGPDRRFHTTCYNYSATVNDATHSMTDLVQTAAGRDDIVMRYAYQEAQIMAGDLWTLTPGATTPTAAISKDLDVHESPMAALALSTTGEGTACASGDCRVTAQRGVQLADQNKVPDTACAALAGNTGLLRYHTGSGGPIAVRGVLAASASADPTTKVPLGTTTSSSVTGGFWHKDATAPSAAATSVAVGAGDTVIVTIAGRSNSAASPFSVTSVEDNQGGSYTAVPNATGEDGASGMRTFIYARYNVTDAPTGITVTYSGGTERSLSWGAMAVSGLAPAPLDGPTAANAARTATGITRAQTVQAASATDRANELAVAVHGYDDAGDANVGYKPAPGWTQIFVNNDAGAYGGFSTVYKIVPADNSTVAHTWSFQEADVHDAATNTALMSVAAFEGEDDTVVAARLEFCDDANAWTAMGGGGPEGGPTNVVDEINDLYDGVGQYGIFSVGLGQYVLNKTFDSDTLVNGTDMTGQRNTALGKSALALAAAGNDNTAAGHLALSHATSSSASTGFGASALAAATTGDGNNTAFGALSLSSSTTGAYNTGFGVGTLSANGTGRYNTAFGAGALAALVNADGATAFGYHALTASTVAGTAFGAQALAANTTGLRNTAFGYGAFTAVTTGSDNTGFGYLAGTGQTGSNNTAAGAEALAAAGTGSRNTAAGYRSLYSNTAGNDNTAAGALALYSNMTGSDNTAAGYRALYSNTTGGSNTAVGAFALENNVAGSDNTAMGGYALNGLSPSQSGTGISIVQTAVSQAFSYTLSFPSLPAAGNTVIAVVSFRANADAADTVTDNQGGTYTRAATRTWGDGVGNYATIEIFYRSAIAAPSGTFTVTASVPNLGASRPAITMMEVSGIGVLDTTGTGADADGWPNVQGNPLTVTADAAASQDNVFALSAYGVQEVSGFTWMGPSAGWVVDKADENDTSGGCDGCLVNTIAHRFANAGETVSVTWNTDYNIRPQVAALAVFRGTSAVAGGAVAGGQQNTAFGWGALAHNVAGNFNTAAGFTSAMFAQGDGNTGVGMGSLYWLGAGNFNTDIGGNNWRWDITHPVSFSGVTTIGMNAGIGAYGTMVGTNTLGMTTGGCRVLPASCPYNTAVADEALYHNTSGAGNTTFAVYLGLINNTTGSYNTQLSVNPEPDNNTTGSYNTAFDSLEYLTTGIGNTGLGGDENIRTGSYNTAVNGYFSSAISAPAGYYNTAFGQDVLNDGDYDSDFSQQTALGAGAYSAGLLGGGGTFIHGEYDDWEPTPIHVANATFAGFDSGFPGGGGTDWNRDLTAIGSHALRGLGAWGTATITGAADNGAGLIRLTVGNAAHFPTGTVVSINGIVGTGNVGALNGTFWIVTYDDATHITLQEREDTHAPSVFGGSWTSGGGVYVSLSNITAIGSDTEVTDDVRAGDTAFGMHANGRNGTELTGINKTSVGYGAGPLPTEGEGHNVTSIGYFVDEYDARLTGSNMIRIGNTSTTLIGGQVGWSQASDRRLKTDIAEADLGLGFIRKLEPVSYRLKQGNGRLDYGFVAQDVQKALGARDAAMVTKGRGKSPWQLSSEELIAPLVSAIQERQHRITRQQDEIDDLTAQVEALEAALADRNGEQK